MRQIQIVFISALLVTAPVAHAFVGTFVPIGHTESVMGNTGVAETGSAASVFYNPAGLGTLESASVSASGTSYYIIQPQNSDNSATSFNALNTVPTLMAMTWRLGEGSVGASLLVPNQLNISASIRNVTFDNAIGALDQDINSIQTKTLAGLSYGRRFTVGAAKNRVHLGASLFYAYDVTTVSTWVSSPIPSASPNSILIVLNTKSTVGSLLPVFGALWEVTPKFNLGVRVGLPSILLSTEKRGTQVTQTYGTSNTLTRSDASSVSWPTLQGMGLSLGMRWQPNAKWVLLADASVEERGAAVNDGSAGDAPIDASVGARYFFGNNWSWLGGTRMDFSDLFNRRDRTEAKNMTVELMSGMSWVTKDLETIIGFLYGRGVQVEAARQQAQATIIDGSRVVFYGFNISGVYKF